MSKQTPKHLPLKNKVSRLWFYFRAGYGFYFVFIISGLNALMIAYFVVLGSVECEAGQTLEDTGRYICAIRFIFPTFAHFVLGAIAIGFPTLITVGYFHYQKNQYGTHAHVNWTTNPYQKTTFLLFLEIIHEMKIVSGPLGKPIDPERTERLEALENKIIDFLEDKRLQDTDEDALFKEF